MAKYKERRKPLAHFNIGKDIWLRARTNAFANEMAVSDYSTWSNGFYVFETIFMVLPIGLVAYAYSIVGATATKPQGNAFFILTLATVISNTLALFLNIISTKLALSESAFRFKEQISLYALIAQKARQLEHDDLTKDDAMQLAKYLQELFESTKSRGLEPEDKYFKKAKILMKGLNTYPFGLTKDNV